MKNVIADGGNYKLVAYYSESGNHSRIENCQVKNAEGGFSHFLYYSEEERSRLDVINTLIVDNTAIPLDRFIWSYNVSCVGFTENNLVNCTIMNNVVEGNPYFYACVNAKLGANLNIYNSCINGNTGYQVAVDTDTGGSYGSTVNISHSLIEGGEEGIPLVGDFPSTLNWLEGNLDCDPMVDDEYKPIQNSPLIDAGTLELPEGIEMPEYDLAGNPRVMGNEIDIGAYEYNPYSHPVGVDEDGIIHNKELFVYPNPFNPEMTVVFFTTESTENTEINIYNVRGQKVANLVNAVLTAGEHSVVWHGKDDRGKQVSSGVYFVRVKIGEEYVAQRKITVIN